jgi:branched-chain amino acid transport system permease protein
MYRMMFFGIAMILMMMFRPGGVWPRKEGRARHERFVPAFSKRGT